ncbi:MAG: DNA repair protein RadC [Cyclobacteriaceae bacterium]|nr:DNA repair protein RadC [Cyclobacteriaceae bacterium]
MYNTHITIKNWAEDDRPREKLLMKGRTSLSTAELIAILLGSGTKNHTALDIAKKLLEEGDNDLSKIARWTVKDMERIKGIGKVRAITIISALELGRRRKDQIIQQKPVITSSSDVYKIVKEKLLDLQHEEFWIVLLNRKNAVISLSQISSGGVAGTVVDPKIIFKKALEELASGIILIHNHPSGNLKPSNEDIKITKNLVESGKLLSVNVFDHIIFTDQGYYSFVDNSLL